jgi:hypothetical protein
VSLLSPSRRRRPPSLSIKEACIPPGKEMLCPVY